MMKKTREELNRELEKTQSFINAVESAETSGLSLTDDVYVKYNEAVERQKKIGEELSQYENGRNGIMVNASLSRKEAEIRSDDCVIEAVEEIPRNDFLTFRNHLLKDYGFISDHINDMYCSRTGVLHCLLVLGEGYEDGILVESEGSSYARYSCLLPDARFILRHHMQPIADFIISEKNESVDYESLRDRYSTDIRSDNYFGKLLTELLLEAKETLAVIVREDSLEVKYVPEHSIRVGDLMNIGLEDFHLLDSDEEHELATITELNQNTLTEAGWEEWDDVLSAKVDKIYEGSLGLQIDVSGCDPQRLKDFSFMLAGYCSEDDYERWVSRDSEMEME